MSRLYLILPILLLFGASAFAQVGSDRNPPIQTKKPKAVPATSGYSIQMELRGLRDTTAYLGYYYGESTYLNDTARVNTMGELIFDGEKKLPQGIYFLVLDKTRIFEFIVGSNQQFRLSTSTEDYVKNMKVVGDEDNRLFFESMLFNADRNVEAEPFVKMLRDSLSTESQKKSAREGLDKIAKKVEAYQAQVAVNHPTMLTSRIMQATRPLQIPDPPKKANGQIDSTFQYRYYRSHFWDGFNLADEALIRLPRPVYQEKIKEYFSRVVPPIADSVNHEIDRLANIARASQETFKYFIWMCVMEFQNPKIMGMDAVYVHLIRTYFDTGLMDFWTNDTLRKNLRERADQIALSMIGQKSPNLIMQDQNLQKRDMHQIRNKYTILFIFDPDCGHCKEETPKLVKFYNTYRTRFDIEVYAVSADTSMQKMKNFIRDFKMPWITVNGPRSYVGSYQKLYDADQTPTIYIMDEKKTIIAKKPPVEELYNFFSNEERRKKLAAGKSPAGSKP